MLKHWLPLNGDISNQGISGNAWGSSNTTYADGILGKAAVFTGDPTQKIYLTNPDKSQIFSWAFWVYLDSVSDKAQFIMSLGRDYEKRGFNIYLPTNKSDLCVMYGGTLGNSTGFDLLNKWTHVAATVNDSHITIYINGIQKVQYPKVYFDYTYAEALTIGKMSHAYASNTTYFPFHGKICDVRVYDHCLSPEEVYEVSKGLLIHYPLSDPYEECYANLYGKPYCAGKPSSCGSSVTLAEKRDTDGNIYYNFSGTHAASSTDNTWYSFSFPNYKFTAGKSYLISIKARRNSCSNISWTMRHARLGNDYFGCKSCTICNSASSTNWKEYYLIQVIPESFIYGDATKVCVPRLEFYTGNLASQESSFDFDIKDVMVVESDHWLPFINGDTGGTIYDTSGYGNHGIVESSTAPSWGSDSPVNNGSMVFESNHFIKFQNPFWNSSQSLATVYQVTFSLWVNLVTSTPYQALLSPYSSPSSNGLWLSVNTEGSAVWAYQGNNQPLYHKNTSNYLANNQWYHVAFVFDNGKSKTYLNGTKLGTDVEWENAFIEYAKQYLSLGDSYTGSSWSGTPFRGKISDFRWYATALSDVDISNLYRRRFTVGTEADFHCAEIEEVSTTSFGKNGVLSCPEIVEMDALECPINGTAWEYTPSTGTNSTLIGFRIPQDTFEIGDTIAVEFDIEWSDFDESNENGTFAIRLQGAMRSQDGTSNWVSNPYTNALSSTSLKSLVLGSTSGYYHYKAITAALTETNLSYAGADVGIRSDYSSGTAHIKISNPHVYNTKNYLDSQKTLLSQDRLLSKIFIEE